MATKEELLLQASGLLGDLDSMYLQGAGCGWDFNYTEYLRVENERLRGLLKQVEKDSDEEIQRLYQMYLVKNQELNSARADTEAIQAQVQKIREEVLQLETAFSQQLQDQLKQNAGSPSTVGGMSLFGGSNDGTESACLQMCIKLLGSMAGSVYNISTQLTPNSTLPATLSCLYAQITHMAESQRLASVPVSSELPPPFAPLTPSPSRDRYVSMSTDSPCSLRMDSPGLQTPHASPPRDTSYSTRGLHGLRRDSCDEALALAGLYNNTGFGWSGTPPHSQAAVSQAMPHSPVDAQGNSMCRVALRLDFPEEPQHIRLQNLLSACINSTSSPMQPLSPTSSGIPLSLHSLGLACGSPTTRSTGSLTARSLSDLLSHSSPNGLVGGPYNHLLSRSLSHTALNPGPTSCLANTFSHLAHLGGGPGSCGSPSLSRASSSSARSSPAIVIDEERLKELLPATLVMQAAWRGTVIRRKFQCLRREVFVGNLPVKEVVDEEELGQCFSVVGEVELVAIMRNTTGSRGQVGLCRGFGFIRFVKVEDAHAALKSMQDVMFRGRALRVDWATWRP